MIAVYEMGGMSALFATTKNYSNDSEFTLLLYVITATVLVAYSSSCLIPGPRMSVYTSYTLTNEKAAKHIHQFICHHTSAPRS